MGSDDLPGGDPELEAARRAWATAFVSAAAGKGLGIVAVTDHHDACFVPYVKEAAEAGGITLFPGVEVTCADNVQCLALFDPGSGDDRFHRLIHRLNDVAPAPATDPKAHPVTLANTTILELMDAIEDDSLLRDSCLIIPHFANETAHKSLNQEGHHKRFAQIESDGVYTECPFAALDAVTLEKVQGRIAEWGMRRRAVLVTGDNRSATWDRLGANDCWIKLGEDSLEAVRQAFLADEARISYAPPELPSERIVRLRVQSTLTGTQPFEILFNEGFSALIGGRGSGKTALLEYLRFGLARSDRDLPQHEIGPRRDREETLIDETLVDGFVEIDLDRAGVKETWRRELETSDHITATDAKGNVTQLTIQEAQRRFRARAFHQKGLSSTTSDQKRGGGDQAKAADQITGIAAAEALDKRREVDQRISAAKREVTTTLQQVAAHWQHQLDRRQAKVRVADLKLRLEALSKRLAEEGVSPEHIKVLEDSPRYSRGRGYFSALANQISTSIAEIGKLTPTILPLNLEDFAGADAFEEIASLNAAVLAGRQQVIATLEQAQQEFSALEDVRKAQLALFEIKDAAFQAEHAQAVAQQTAQRALIDENSRLSQDLQAAEASEVSAAAAETASQAAVKSFSDARETLKKLLDQRRTILADAAEQVAGKSSEMLKARLKRDPEPAEFIESLVALCESTYVPDPQSRCQQWVKAVIADPDNGWEALCDGLLAVYAAKIAAGSPSEPSQEMETAIKGLMFNGEVPLTSNMIKRIYANLEDRTVGAVISAIPRDYIILKYVEDGIDIPFEKASPGQQASALLELLLSQSAGTLVIDQPEDDIDNRIIMKVVGLIRSSKHRRQLIFATHNPNIVVNGDADKVVALRSGDLPVAPLPTVRTIDISSDGAIETDSVRADITRVMEGGRAAFDLRSRKYHFEGTIPGEASAA